jgi:saccharopine dehydrogenase-like NADP-dependent oxidoreductase
MAGKAGAHYREDGEEKRLSHEELFTAHNTVDVPGLGQLSWYPNRDSLSYTSLYELEDIPTFVRTTLRHPDFMLGWKHVIELNLTDESPQYNSDGKSLGEVYKQHLDKNGFAEWLTKNQAELTLKQLLYLGLDDRHTKLNKGMMSPADLLQFSLEKKLALETGDRDMIVMLHEIGSTTGNIRSSLVVKGEDNRYTAMAKTVGLPLAIAAKLILNGRLTLTGLQIPTSKEIYYPVLKELAEYGISFHEEKTALA